MFSTKTEKDSSKKRYKKNIPTEIANILDELITAFIMTLLIVIFVIRPYIIPTGSMADTLMGAHFRLRCPQCGFSYEHDFSSRDYGLPENAVPHGKVKPPRSRCPSCGYYSESRELMPVTKGDKILALKCIYQFFEPKRWDVVVFRSPLEPQTNYIKRLVGRPGETVKIIDGDVYVDGQISRKPPKVQKELWMPVYDNDYQPAKPNGGSFNGRAWRQPFDVANSEWSLDESNPAVFCLDTTPDRTSYLKYDTTLGNDFRATYAYNDVARYSTSPHCSDLKLRFYACPSDSFGCIGASLSKYQTLYKAQIDLTGQILIKRITDDRETILASKTIEPLTAGKPTLIEFANVDHRLFFRVGNEKLTYDLGRAPDDAGQREPGIEPEVKIFGAGKIKLSHVTIFRDVYYTAIGNPGPTRATEDNPLALREDEFFVLGDNSPISADGRVWHRPGMGNNGRSYRKGIVPREYLVGKAILVFWPSGFRPFAQFPFACIPNIGRMRIIHGGSDKEI